MKKLIIFLVITLLGLGLAYNIGIGDKEIMGFPVLFICAIWAFGLNWLAFIPAAITQSEKYYDLVGTLTYISTIAIALFTSQPVDLRAMAVALLVVIWAARLGIFLFRRVRRDNGDHRFDKIKTDPLRFLVTWTLQGLWVTLTALCALYIITTENATPWDIFATIGVLMWGVGFALEAIADAQKSDFKVNPANQGKFINTGLWSRSQHPNYFGEILLWSGIAVMALPLLSGLKILALISPLFVYLLLTRVSGIPLLQKKAKERWGDNPDFKVYQASTPLLFPKLGK